ncbi:MAG: YtxH domain-containing protein [Syntrophobacterales bacterium]
MENPSFYLWIGLALGAVVGAGAAFLYARIRGFFAKSEVSQLRQENRALKQRLEKKDKHIQEMMYHTEKIAAGLVEKKTRGTDEGS